MGNKRDKHAKCLRDKREKAHALLRRIVNAQNQFCHLSSANTYCISQLILLRHNNNSGPGNGDSGPANGNSRSANGDLGSANGGLRSLNGKLGPVNGELGPVNDELGPFKRRTFGPFDDEFGVAANESEKPRRRT